MLNKKKILLVEDDRVTGLLQKKQLEQRGYIVKHVLTPEDAIKTALDKEENIDLILMDIDLSSNIDGTELSEYILKHVNIPLIFVSSHTEQEIVEKTEKLTSYGYVVKNSGITILDTSIKMAFKLYDAKSIFKDTFNYSINGLCIYKMLYDDNGNPYDCKYVDVSPSYEKHIGFSPDFVIGRTIREVYPNNQALDIIKMYYEAIQKGSYTIEEYYSEIDQKWFELSIFSMKNDLFTVVIQNITDKIKILEDLKRKERNYRKLFEDHSAAQIIIDPNTGIVINVNKTAEKFYGYTRKELLSNNIQDLVPISQEYFEKQLSISEESNEPFLEFEHPVANGEIKQIKAFMNRMCIDDKEYLHFIIFDVTEYKNIEKKYIGLLEEQNKFNRLIMDNLPVGIAVNTVFPKVEFVYMNDKFPEIYRTTREELSTPDKFFDVVYKDPIFREKIKKQILDDISTGDPKKMFWENVPILCDNGQTVYVSAYNVPIPNSNFMMSIVYNIDNL